MFNLNREEILKYIQEDLPYFDLTTYLQESNRKRAKLSIFSREDIIVSCTEETSMIANLLECETLKFLPSQTYAKKGKNILVFEGDYENVHKAWKLCQILLEYSCKITTYTHRMLQNIQEVNPKCQLLGTRKTFPLSKKLCIKAILAGGAMPHRLNLSDTVLFFAQHRVLYKNDGEFFAKIEEFKTKIPEKKIVIESKTYDDALRALQSGADGVQLDKMPLSEIEKTVCQRDKNFSHIKLLCAGGINIDNAKEYAKTGVDAIVTSAFYSCGMADISSKIEVL